MINMSENSSKVMVSQSDLFALRDVALKYLDGKITGERAAELAWDGFWEIDEKIPEDDSTIEVILFESLFWALILLDEPKEYRTKSEELSYLVSCVENPAIYKKETADSFG